MIYLNTVAVKTRSREVIMGNTVSDFIEALGKKNKDGRTRKAVLDQLHRITNTHMQLSFHEKQGDVIHKKLRNLTIVRELDLWWKEKDPTTLLFPSMIEFTEDYFENLMEHAVPLDERAIYALSQNALALDIYAWLAQRLHRLNKPINVTWKALKDQFGGYGRMDHFKLAFRRALKDVHSVYPQARIEEEQNKYFTLYKSPAPISSETLVPIRKVA